MTQRFVALTFLVLTVWLPANGWADHGGSHEDVSANQDEGVLTATAEQQSDPTKQEGETNDPITEVSTGPQPQVKLVPVCVHGDPSVDGAGYGCPSGEQLSCGEGGLTFTMIVSFPGNQPSVSSTVCIEPGDPPPANVTPPVDIPSEVLNAFKKVELPASTINIQPPGGQTLVNFKTILSTPAAKHQITVHLDKVDVDVVLEVWPSHFLWKHGDGTGQESTVAGAVWSEGADVDGADFITHVYTQKLTAAQVSVDTTWSARFKGPNDPDWRPVNGTVTKVGEPLSLAVREATPQLVTQPN